jgi:hypothetical protein
LLSIGRRAETISLINCGGKVKVRLSADRELKLELASPRISISTFDDLDLVIARDGRRDFAAIIAGGIRVTHVLAGRSLNIDCNIVPVTDLFGP